jgi:phosphoheptose isomerase
MHGTCREYLVEVADVAARLDLYGVHLLKRQVEATAARGGCVYVAGNGGSGTVADHFVLGLTLNALREGGRPCRAAVLGAGAAALSGAINDFGYDAMFAAQLQVLAESRDMAVGLSSSGRSENIAAMLRRAAGMGLRTAAIVGRDGPVAQAADVRMVVGTDSPAVCEDVTIMLLHWVYGKFMEAPCSAPAPAA